MPQMRQNVAGTQNKFTGVFQQKLFCFNSRYCRICFWLVRRNAVFFFFAEEGGSDGQRVASADLNAMECLVSKRFLVGRMQ
jgi:hypothetical protein